MKAVTNKDKAAWLECFAPDAWVRDPVGGSPLDPRAEGFRGHEAIAKLWDGLIAPLKSVRFEVREEHPSGNAIARVATVQLTLPTGGFSRPAVCPGPAAAGPHRPVLRRALGPPQAALRRRALCRRARARAQVAVPLHPSRPARAPRHHHLAARSAPRCCPFSAAVDDAPRPRLPRRHLRLLPLLRAHARHSGRHHTAGDCRRAPRCSAAAASPSCRTTAAVLAIARSPLSLAPPARRFAPRSSRRAGELDSVRLRSPVAARFLVEWLGTRWLSFALHPAAAPLRSLRHLMPPAVLLHPGFFPLHFA